MGYSNVGTVIGVGEGVDDIEIGTRVASNGPHAEVVSVPKNLTLTIPDRVEDDQAAFTVLGSIALQGVRLVNPTLGESVVVFGLGLVGLLGIQLLEAQGARVLGFDTDPCRVELARAYGVNATDLSTEADPVDVAREFCGPAGVDGVLITATTQSNDLIHQAAQMSRKRGRIILTGIVGLDLQRSDFYEKELTFQVSASYGPGRYDPEYEKNGIDYPIGFVRWTERRNFATIVDLLNKGRLDVQPLISARFPINEAPTAYSKLLEEDAVGVMLDYPQPRDDDTVSPAEPARLLHHSPMPRSAGQARGAIIGAGGFALDKLLPALTETGATLRTVVARNGLNASAAARRFDIDRSATDPELVFDDPDVDFVVVATRHDSHANYVVRALDAGKSVFVEKPLGLTHEELDAVAEAYTRATGNGETRPLLMVGFNRRFSPLTVKLQELLQGRHKPVAMTFTCNAGRVPEDSWVHDPEVGGGRIIGEACHFIDLLQHFADAPITEVDSLVPEDVCWAASPDTMTINLKFADGSIGTVHYFSNGSRRYPKETCQIFSDGRILYMDNFRRLTAYGFKAFKRKRLIFQDKGHSEEIRQFVESVRLGGVDPIPFVQLMRSSRAAVDAASATNIT
jgi:predicted dehydrogenase/threonine dehydrogenase-like Zn-dependent dehydrogenase